MVVLVELSSIAGTLGWSSLGKPDVLLTCYYFGPYLTS
jgi:hypothetical protein